MSGNIAVFALIVYLVGIILIFRFSRYFLKNYPNLEKIVPFLEVFTVTSFALFFIYELIKTKEDDLGGKKTTTMEYLSDLDTAPVRSAKREIDNLSVLTYYYLNNPTQKLKLISGESGTYDNFIGRFLVDGALTLADYRQKVSICVQNDVCDKDLTKLLVCEHTRKYNHAVGTYRARTFEICMNRGRDDLQLVNMDPSYEYMLNMCAIEHVQISEFPAGFLENAGDEFCKQIPGWKKEE